MNANAARRLSPAPRRLNPIRLAAGVLLAAAAVSAAQAQNLSELYESARAYDATFLSARSAYEASLAKAEQARAGLLPQAGLSAGATWNRRDSSVPPLDNSNFNTQNVTLSASQPLYRPANAASNQQGQLSIDIAKAQLDSAEQDLIVRTAQAYFDVLAAEDSLTVVKAQKSAVSEQLAAAKRNFEVGTTTVTDSREAQARYDLVVAQEIAAENDLRVKKLALDQLVGKTDVSPRPLATPVAMPALWFLFGMCGQVAVLAYPWLSHHFGVELSGRAHTAINLILFASAFVLQYAIGAGIGQFVPRATGGYDTHAYQVVFGAVLILQLVALAWYGLNRSAILRSPASS